MNIFVVATGIIAIKEWGGGVCGKAFAAIPVPLLAFDFRFG